MCLLVGSCHWQRLPCVVSPALSKPRFTAQDLVKAFPEEEQGIKDYIKLCQKVNKSADMYFYAKIFSKPLQWFLNLALNGEYLKWSATTAWDAVSSLIQSPRLKSILCGQFGDYGVHPEQASFTIQAGITAHYMGGAYYPIGGSQEIARALIPTIERSGGRVLVRAAVEQILIDDAGKAVGVTVQGTSSEDDQADSVTIRSRHGVICGAGAVTLEKLVPARLVETLGYRAMLEAPKP